MQNDTIYNDLHQSSLDISVEHRIVQNKSSDDQKKTKQEQPRLQKLIIRAFQFHSAACTN